MTNPSVDPPNDRPRYLWTNRRPASRLDFSEPCDVTALVGPPEIFEKESPVAPESLVNKDTPEPSQECSEHSVLSNPEEPLVPRSASIPEEQLLDVDRDVAVYDEREKSEVPELNQETTADHKPLRARNTSDERLIARLRACQPLYRAHHALIMQMLTDPDTDLGKVLRANVVHLLAETIVNRNTLPNTLDLVPVTLMHTMKETNESGAIAKIGREHVTSGDPHVREYVSALTLTFQSFSEIEPASARARIFMPSDALNHKLRTWAQGY